MAHYLRHSMVFPDAGSVDLIDEWARLVLLELALAPRSMLAPFGHVEEKGNRKRKGRKGEDSPDR